MGHKSICVAFHNCSSASGDIAKPGSQLAKPAARVLIRWHAVSFPMESLTNYGRPDTNQTIRDDLCRS